MTTELRRGKNLKLLIVASTRVKKGKVWGVFSQCSGIFHEVQSACLGSPLCCAARCDGWNPPTAISVSLQAIDFYRENLLFVDFAEADNMERETEPRKGVRRLPGLPISLLYTQSWAQGTLPASCIRSVRTNSRCGEAESVRLKIATGRSFLSC